MIGVVASFSYVAFFLLFVGRALAPRVGVIRLFAWAWLFRYIAFLPVLFAPVFLLADNPTLVFTSVGIGVLGFHVCRGVGIVANAPMFSGFSSGTDRGRLLSQFQMIASVVAIVIGIAVAYLLGERAEIGRYTLFLSAGVASGTVATGLLFSLPELEEESKSAKRPLLPVIREMTKRPEIRRFFMMFLLIAIASGIGRSFLIVYAKQFHGLSDRLAFLMVAIGSLGNFLAGYLGSVLLDRLGARPLILFSLSAYLVSVVLAVLVPPIGGIAVTIAIGLIFFFGTLGFSGNENSSQAYFYGVTNRDDRLNLGIIFFLTLGLGGTFGSFTGGFILDALVRVFDTTWAFRVVFCIAAVIALLAYLRANRLASLGAETFRGTLEVIFSPRDLRTVGLLNRLDRTRDPEEEKSTIRSLASSGSGIAVGDVIDRLGSPSYAVRQEALEALSSLPYTLEVESALIRHLNEAVHTTAFQAARILGLRGTAEAIAPIRRAIDSPDTNLSDRAVVAYARLARHDAMGDLRTLLTRTENPRRLMHIAVAIQIAGERSDLPLLFEQLNRPALPEYVIDEIILAAAQILEMHEWFYPRYSDYIRGRDGRTPLAEELRAVAPAEVKEAITVLIDREDPARACEALRSTLDAQTAEIIVSLPTRGRIVFFVLCAHLYPRIER